MVLLYINKFIPKQPLFAKLKEGKVYKATVEGDSYLVEHGDTTFLLNGLTTDDDGFYAEVEEITNENRNNFAYTKQDKMLVFSTFDAPKIMGQLNQIGEQVEHQAEKEINDAFDDLGELCEFDPALFLTFAKVAKYINSTFDDKYEASAFPEIDLTGLMRNSKGGRFFNCGNAAKYLKRYMTDGYAKSNNPDDVYKALHYLLLELDRRINEEPEL